MYQYIDLKAKSRNFQNCDVKNPTLYTVKYDYRHGKYLKEGMCKCYSWVKY